ncbi:MAG: hypothetical protein HUJ63_03660 [Enterococcus sp.]|nr:hypothetical protein [Enterococcus sp.]
MQEERLNSNSQIKTRERVAQRGEVFTNEREVNAMLDLVKDETQRIDSRFLEPACGNGNFLAEILRRKLAVVKKLHNKNALDYERYAFLAVSSIYGVDIMEDNVEECRERLHEIVQQARKKDCKDSGNARFEDAVKFVLSRNILCGDALTLLQNNGEPIIFSEWSFVSGDKVKRRDFRLDEMLEGNQEQMSLFGSSGSATTDWVYDNETESYIPSPIKEYPLQDFYQVGAK